MIMFGLQPSAELQRKWDAKGDIGDDPFHATSLSADEGLMSFSGDPDKGAGSRSTLLFFTMRGKHLMSNLKTPWEVPTGKIVRGLDVLKNIYSGYHDEPRIGYLNSSWTQRPAGVPDAAAYWQSFARLDRFVGCRVAHDRNVSTDPNANRHDEL